MQVPQVREALVNNDWKQVASEAVSGPLNPQNLAAANRERMEGMLAALDFLAERHDLTVSAAGNNDGQSETPEHPPVKVSVYMKHNNGTMVNSQSLELSVDINKPPVPVTLKV
jgi:hypothetical protein